MIGLNDVSFLLENFAWPCFAGYLAAAGTRLKKDRQLLVWLHESVIGDIDSLILCLVVLLL